MARIGAELPQKRWIAVSLDPPQGFAERVRDRNQELFDRGRAQHRQSWRQDRSVSSDQGPSRRRWPPMLGDRGQIGSRRRSEAMKLVGLTTGSTGD